jgi:hypothetical protein
MKTTGEIFSLNLQSKKELIHLMPFPGVLSLLVKSTNGRCDFIYSRVHIFVFFIFSYFRLFVFSYFRILVFSYFRIFIFSSLYAIFNFTFRIPFFALHVHTHLSYLYFIKICIYLFMDFNFQPRAQTLLDYYDGSLSKALKQLFPDIDWKKHSIKQGITSPSFFLSLFPLLSPLPLHHTKNSLQINYNSKKKKNKNKREKQRE